MSLAKYTIERVPYGKCPAPTPTNTQRLRDFKVKSAMKAEVTGNSFFRFTPIFDPPENHDGYNYRS